MLLRRVIEHVRTQNWTAVGLDFFIVVVGVFIGIQVSNWNDARSDRTEYMRALERLETETLTNLATLDALEPQITQSLKTVKTAFDILRSCIDSAENRRIVGEGIDEMRGTYGLHLRRKALEEITSNPRLLAQQSAAARQRFTDMLYYFDLMEGEATFAEFYPIENRFENNSIIGVGDTVIHTDDYFGADFTKTQRPLTLKAAVDEACEEDRLVKAFFSWERWQDNVPVAIRQIRKELEATKALLTEIAQ